MQADEHLKATEKLGQTIKDAKDQEIFLGDLNSGDWYGIKQSLFTLPSQKSCERPVSQTHRADYIFHFLYRSQNLSMISHSR